MRIERISDNQIRCTLSKNDLVERHLKISELAYGSDKAKELFRDMMEQANMDFGFEADDIPLLIEAIPTSKESIVLVITKVEDPEEFEERFSSFGNIANKFDLSGEADADTDDSLEEDEPDFEGDLVNCFEQLNEMIEQASEPEEGKNGFVPLHEILKKAKKNRSTSSSNQKHMAKEAIRLYSFSSLPFAIDASKAVFRIYCGKNSMWKDENANCYYLLLHRSEDSDTFDRVCSILNEFGKKEAVTYATQDFFNEHYKLILKDDAISRLSLL